MQTGIGNESSSQRAQLRYHFNVGSVDSFERKLDEAQEDLGWDPANFIPVTYCSEFSFVSEFTKLLPTILIIAGYVWFTRRSMGGLGGPGGPGGRGLFNVGKAQVLILPPQDLFCEYRVAVSGRKFIIQVLQALSCLKKGLSKDENQW